MPFSVVLEEGQDSIDHMEEIVYTHKPILEVIQPLIDLQFGRRPIDEVRAVIQGLSDLRPALATAVADLAREVKRTGMAITPTLVAFETIWRQTTNDYSGLLGANEMKYMSPITRVNWGPRRNRYRTGGCNHFRECLSGVRFLIHRLIKQNHTGHMITKARCSEE